MPAKVLSRCCRAATSPGRTPVPAERYDESPCGVGCAWTRKVEAAILIVVSALAYGSVSYLVCVYGPALESGDVSAFCGAGARQNRMRTSLGRVECLRRAAGTGLNRRRSRPISAGPPSGDLVAIDRVFPRTRAFGLRRDRSEAGAARQDVDV